MNNPHVTKLFYRVTIGDNVDFDRADPLVFSNEIFDLYLDTKIATFEMKKHYSTTLEAKSSVEPFIRAWHIYRPRL